MKFPQAATYTLIATSGGLAAPVTEGKLDALAPQSPNRQDLALRTLDKRINCSSIRRVVHAIGTSKFVPIFVSHSHTLTREICLSFGGERCDNIAQSISTALSLIYTAAALTSGAVPDVLNARKRSADIHAEFVDWWAKSLTANSEPLIYDSIKSLPLDAAEEKLARRDGDPALVTRLVISGASQRNATDPVKQDIVIHHYADGNTQLHLPIGKAATNHLGKRDSGGPGFKLSYTTRKKTQLTYSHQQEMAAYGAANWAVTSSQTTMTDYIGFAETGHDANFYYRIIPESRAFGLNYESVDICGQMGGYL